jgi:hypothetical protein
MNITQKVLTKMNTVQIRCLKQVKAETTCRNAKQKVNWKQLTKQAAEIFRIRIRYFSELKVNSWFLLNSLITCSLTLKQVEPLSCWNHISVQSTRWNPNDWALDNKSEPNGCRRGRSWHNLGHCTGSIPWNNFFQPGYLSRYGLYDLGVRVKSR